MRVITFINYLITNPFKIRLRKLRFQCLEPRRTNLINYAKSLFGHQLHFGCYSFLFNGRRQNNFRSIFVDFRWSFTTRSFWFLA